MTDEKDEDIKTVGQAVTDLEEHDKQEYVLIIEGKVYGIKESSGERIGSTHSIGKN